MFHVLKLLHFGGLVIFLGSILTFIVISALIENASLENLVFGRKIISTGTAVLTVPGIWTLAITGIWMGYSRYGLKCRFFQLKLLIIVLMLLNTYFIILPSVSSATDLAIQSLAQGQLLPQYKSAYMKESVFGALNVLFTISAAVIGVWKIGIKSSTQD